MVNDLLLLWIAAFPLMGSPGPATLSLAGIGTAFGFRMGLPYLAGIVLGTISVLLLVATGVTAIMLAQPVLVGALTIIAVGYILYLAWKIVTAPVGTGSVQTTGAPDLMSGIILAIANPKAFAAIGAVYASQNLSPDNLATDAIAKTAALVFVIIVVSTTWLGFGSAFAGLLSHPRFGRIVNVLFALMLVTSVGVALLDF